MDPILDVTSNSLNGIQLENQSMDEFPIQCTGAGHLPNGAVNSTSSVDIDDDNQNYGDLSDGVLRYIDQILMEEDMDDMTHTLQDSSDFRAKEQSFYEILGEKYPPSPLQQSPLNVQYNHHNDVVDPNACTEYYDANHTNYVVSNSSISSSSNLNDIMSQVVWNYRKGIDDASKFLPSGSEMLGTNGVLVQNPNDEPKLKSPNNDENDAVSNVPIEEINDVWIYTVDEREQFLASHIKNLEIAGTKGSQKGGLVNRGPSGAKGRPCKKTYTKNEGIDLTSLLVNCAQSISAGDHRTANELLKQIRQHSSPSGDGTQRLAHYFADGLEARLAGTGSKIYRALVHEGTTSTNNNMLAYGMSLASSTFRKISSFASNEFIMIKSEKATSVHIIDFGIFYGFQWPIFIKHVARREGGPPKLRITGIDFPQPGPIPVKRNKDTGRRLAHYAEMFNVPFEYNAIAKNWETIKVEDLKIERGEFVVVTCSVASKNLVDDTDEECSKTMFLDLIRKINPHIFIHDILNAGYSVPFFVTRLREALFFFSALFDMVETFLPGNKPERMMIERDVLGNGILNVVACEGRERVERPEKYYQWQFRHLRAGFMQVPFERKLMDRIMYKVRNSYHRDFLLDEDNMWVFMGWKGRVLHAMSCWEPL